MEEDKRLFFHLFNLTIPYSYIIL